MRKFSPQMSKCCTFSQKIGTFSQVSTPIEAKKHFLHQKLNILCQFCSKWQLFVEKNTQIGENVGKFSEK